MTKQRKGGSLIDHSECHPGAGVWVACSEWQIRIECAECQAEVQAFQLAVPYKHKEGCSFLGCTSDGTGPMYFHCRCNPMSGGNTVTVFPDECSVPGCSCGMKSRALISCASCNTKQISFALAEHKPTAWNPTQKVPSVN